VGVGCLALHVALCVGGSSDGGPREGRVEPLAYHLAEKSGLCGQCGTPYMRLRSDLI